MVGFRKGWSGSPFHTGYDANTGMDAGPMAAGSERGPAIGPGVMAKRVSMAVSKNANAVGRKSSSSKKD
jgi:hypothetical protein